MLKHIFLGLCLLAGNCAFADIIGNGSWQTFPTSLNHDGSPYFDYPSYDTDNHNIGECLVAGCGVLPPMAPATLQYYGYADGTADPSLAFSYLKPASTPIQFTLVASETAYADSLYWYGSDPRDTHLLFGPGTTTGTVATINTSAPFHLMLMAGDGQTYYSQSQFNSVDPGHQMFAPFRQMPGLVYLGIEDVGPTAGGIEHGREYRDWVVQMQLATTPTPTPEPATFGLIGATLIGIVVTTKKRRAA